MTQLVAGRSIERIVRDSVPSGFERDGIRGGSMYYVPWRSASGREWCRQGHETQGGSGCSVCYAEAEAEKRALRQRLKARELLGPPSSLEVLVCPECQRVESAQGKPEPVDGLEQLWCKDHPAPLPRLVRVSYRLEGSC